MRQSHHFNELVEWKYTLLKMKKVSFLCEACREELDEKLKCIEKQMNEIIDDNNGVII